MGQRAARRVDLIRAMDLLQRHRTPALCQAAFRRVRNSERQRVRTVHALVQFWTAVILRAPQALSQALADAVADREPLFRRVEASPEAFFQRCRALRPAFFAAVFGEFTARLLAEVPARYAGPLAPVQARFTAIVVIDGSRLAAIARRLKLVWNELAVILPGALLAWYDVGRRLCLPGPAPHRRCGGERDDAGQGRPGRARPGHPRGRRSALRDRRLLRHPARAWLLGLVRRNRLVTLRKRQRLRRRRHAGGLLKDWLVQAGTGVSAPVQTLRSLRWRCGGTRYELLTNVLDPARLTAVEALALYPARWSAGGPRRSRGGGRHRARGDLAREVLPEGGRGVPRLRGHRAHRP